MDEVTKQILDFNNARNWDQFYSPKNLVKSISIDASGLLEYFQRSNKPGLNNVKSELADIIDLSYLIGGKD